MILGRVLMRSLMGAGAWVAGAAAATAGSLLAVSLLGQGILASPGPQLTVTAAKQAPAAKPARPRTSARVPARHPPQAGSRRPAGHPSSRPAASPASQSTGGTVLTSQGGTVVATCTPSGAYLVSWSPTQGYQADDVVRGPASTTRVDFDSDQDSVAMTVSCRSGVPVAATYVHHADE